MIHKYLVNYKNMLRFEKYQIHKKLRLRKCFRLKETKENMLSNIS